MTWPPFIFGGEERDITVDMRTHEKPIFRVSHTVSVRLVVPKKIIYF